MMSHELAKKYHYDTIKLLLQQSCHVCFHLQQFFMLHVSVTKQYSLVLGKRRWSSVTGKVTVNLVYSNSSQIYN